MGRQPLGGGQVSAKKGGVAPPDFPLDGAALGESVTGNGAGEVLDHIVARLPVGDQINAGLKLVVNRLEDGLRAQFFVAPGITADYGRKHH
jgi:hypothetical protein